MIEFMSVSRQPVCFPLPSSLVIDAWFLLVFCCCFSKEYRKQNIDVEDEHRQISLIRRNWVILLTTSDWDVIQCRTTEKEKGAGEIQAWLCTTKFWQSSLLSTFRNLFESPKLFLAALLLKPHLHYTVSSEQTYRQEEEEQEEEKERKKQKRERRREREERRRRKEHRACFGLQ